MKVLTSLLYPFTWLIAQGYRIYFWHLKRLETKNEQWRNTMHPGDGCFVRDKTGRKIRAQVVNFRYGEHGDVKVSYTTIHGQLITENYRKKNVFKY